MLNFVKVAKKGFVRDYNQVKDALNRAFTDTAGDTTGSGRKPDDAPCPFCGTPVPTMKVKQCSFCKKDWQSGSEHAAGNNGAESGGSKKRAEQAPGRTIPEACRTLNLSGEITLASVRRAYRKAIVQWHPDRVEGLAPELVELATRRTVEINRAYELLLSSLK